MPTYEYLCKNCGERFEKVQSFSARPLKKHATCGGELQKVFHASGVVFKGPGFYATDSRAARASKETSADSTGDSASTSDKADTKTEGAKKDTPKKETATTKSTPSAAAAAD